MLLQFRLQLELEKAFSKLAEWETRLVLSDNEKEKQLARGYIYELNGKVDGLQFALDLVSEKDRPA